MQQLDRLAVVFVAQQAVDRLRELALLHAPAARVLRRHVAQRGGWRLGLMLLFGLDAGLSFLNTESIQHCQKHARSLGRGS